MWKHSPPRHVSLTYTACVYHLGGFKPLHTVYDHAFSSGLYLGKYPGALDMHSSHLSLLFVCSYLCAYIFRVSLVKKYVLNVCLGTTESELKRLFLLLLSSRHVPQSHFLNRRRLLSLFMLIYPSSLYFTQSIRYMFYLWIPWVTILTTNIILPPATYQ